MSPYARIAHTMYGSAKPFHRPNLTVNENRVMNVYAIATAAGITTVTSGISAVDFVSAMKSSPMDIVVGIVSTTPLHFGGTRSAIKVWKAITRPPMMNDAASCM